MHALHAQQPVIHPREANEHSGLPARQCASPGESVQEVVALGKSTRAGADMPSPTEQQTSVRRCCAAWGAQLTLQAVAARDWPFLQCLGGSLGPAACAKTLVQEVVQ